MTRIISRISNNTGSSVSVTIVDEVDDGSLPMPAERKVIAGEDYLSILDDDGLPSEEKIKNFLLVANKP